MNYWIFKVNPEENNIDNYLNSSETNAWWQVKTHQKEIKKGDTVFFWRTGTPRGVYAVMEIVKNPCVLPGDVTPGPWWISVRRFERSGFWAECRLIQHFPLIETKEIRRIRGLEHFSFYKAFQQATNFAITFEEGTILAKYIEKVRPETRGSILPFEHTTDDNKESQTELSITTGILSTLPADYSERGLFKCIPCDKMMFGYDCENHVLNIHVGKGVEWKKIR
ncbi:MAG: EVE domain-containing protein [Chloroflexi bacterium]|nr:EVE domain-containing protein [Chloroflexota bacterium]